MQSDVVIMQAAIPDDLATVRELFLEYAESLEFSLCFQGFDQELQNLPGCYARPDGCLLLAKTESETLGVVGMRPLGQGYCEMKRLYLRPQARGLGIGRCLIEAVLSVACERGYRAMRLDTLKSMETARTLYQAYGFEEIAAYYENPLPEATYYERPLQDRTQR